MYPVTTSTIDAFVKESKMADKNAEKKNAVILAGDEHLYHVTELQWYHKFPLSAYFHDLFFDAPPPPDQIKVVGLALLFA